MKFSFYKQHDSMQCGIACIQMICAYYGKTFTSENISNMCFATSEGVSLLGIRDTFIRLGMQVTSARVSLSELCDSTLPCVLHWEQNHFVVLYRIKHGKTYYVADPGKGKLTYSEDEFKKHWISTNIDGTDKGIALFIAPTQEFACLLIRRYTLMKCLNIQKNKMEKGNLVQLLCLLMSFIASGCCNTTSILNFSKRDFNNAPSKIIKIGSFDTIIKDGPYSIDFVQSPEYKVILMGTQTLFDSVTISNRSNKLYLSMEPGTYSDVWLKVTVCAPDLKTVVLDGPGDIYLDSINVKEDFKIIADGPGDILANYIKCGLLEIEVSGPGDVLVKNVDAKDKKIHSSGPGNIDVK